MTAAKQSYRPPKAVSNNAQRGKDLKERYGRGGHGVAAVGTKGASAGLAKGEGLSLDQVRKMSEFFSSHPDSFKPHDTEDDGGPSTATIDWLLCGGTAGKNWAGKILSQEKEESVKKQFKYNAEVLKVDETLGLVMGFAIICKQDGEDYYDLQDDHIPEDAMLKAAVEFMQGARTVGDMHQEEEGGSVVFAWPLTSEIAKAFNLKTDTTGLMIAMKPKNQKTLEKFRDGEYNGFSIGGVRIQDEEVANG